MALKLEELRVYEFSMELGERVWEVVKNWDYLSKDTIGKQLIRSVDSIAANISEGFGRFHFKDAKKFVYYSRGSLYETKTWLTKAYNRKLIDEDVYNNIKTDLDSLGIMLNRYINSIGTTNNKSEE